MAVVRDYRLEHLFGVVCLSYSARPVTGKTTWKMYNIPCILVDWNFFRKPRASGSSSSSLKGLVHGNVHARRLSLQNKFVGSTLNSKSPLPVQSLKILRFIRTSVALAGLVILR